jgi:hypothetical protein
LTRVALVSQAEFARRRGLSRQAVHKRLVDQGGPIPVYGPDKKLDEAEADRLWAATMSSQGRANSRHPDARGTGHARRRTAADPPPAAADAALGPHAYARARTAAMIADAQAKRLAVEVRQGRLVERDRAVAIAFTFARRLRDAWLAWPARVAPEVAAELGLPDAGALMAALELRVHRQVEELAAERFDL